MKSIIIYLIIIIFIITSGLYLTRTTETNSKIYSITHYTDTINGHIILSTVCDYNDNISISTLELNNNDTINVR